MQTLDTIEQPYSRGMRALEAVNGVAREYGLPTGEVKPCVALLLDGNLGGAERHQAAFVIAIECRRIGLDQAAATRILLRWAPKVGYRTSEVRGAVISAYGRNPDGEWRYRPPGLVKKPGGAYGCLVDTCRDVGCPNQCPPLKSKGMRSETFQRFQRLGWVTHLRQRRRGAAADVYGAICEFEEQIGLPPGATVRVSHSQLARRAERSRQNVSDNLDFLHREGLLSRLVLGSGSGPRARNRVATELVRTVPIPPVKPPIKDRAPHVPHIEHLGDPYIGHLASPRVGSVYADQLEEAMHP